MIAELARVTPSTIYRHWGDLSQLLADVAAERLRPVAEPDDTGSLKGDLEAFVLQCAEEMSSEIGRQLLRDILSEGGGVAARCRQYTIDHLSTLNRRALSRSQAPFAVEMALDLMIAPLVYHILFSDRAATEEYVRSLLARSFDATGVGC